MTTHQGRSCRLGSENQASDSAIQACAALETETAIRAIRAHGLGLTGPESTRIPERPQRAAEPDSAPRSLADSGP